MYAVAKPEKFKEIINEKIDGLLIKIAVWSFSRIY